MSLVELIISTSIFSLVVAGSISSAILFVKIAADHENRADFTSDLRSGMETMSFDVRNAIEVSARTDTGFSLRFPNTPAVSYSYDGKGLITRTQDGQSRSIFKSVIEFDVLTGPSDEPTDNSLVFDRELVSIETLSFRANRGASGPSKLTMKNFSLKLRNQ